MIKVISKFELDVLVTIIDVNYESFKHNIYFLGFIITGNEKALLQN